MEKMKENKAGQYIPHKFASEIIETLEEREDISEDFARGAAVTLSFLTCPKGESMHGAPLNEFIDNALSYINDMPPEEVISQAEAVIAQLRAAGINVVSAGIVKVVD